MVLRCILFFVLLTPIWSRTTLPYEILPMDDESTVICIREAMHFLEEGTCLHFSESSEEEEGGFSIVPSRECVWQQSNRTIHLNGNCATPSTCVELLGRMLAVVQPQHRLRQQINVAYNCSDHCSIDCRYGGKVRDNCTCECAYGFEGEHCEILSREKFFNDDSCGRVDATDAGSVALSTYPNYMKKDTAVFCQWLIESEDPWNVLEVAFEGEMDGEGLPSGQTCNDILTVYGANHNAIIPCNGDPTPILRSASNWILIEFRGNPWAIQPHIGPSIKYSLHSRSHGVRTISSEMTSGVGAILASSLASSLAILALVF